MGSGNKQQMFTYISNSAHYKEVLSRVQSVKHTLWIGTADIKDLYVEVGKEKNVSSKREQKEHALSAEWEKGRAKLKPFLALIAQLIRRGVEVRLIHAKEPGPNFREDFDKYPVLYDRLERVLCPRVHLTSSSSVATRYSWSKLHSALAAPSV
jgi:hypothetical protein